MNDDLLPVQRVGDVEEQHGVRWLVEGLWTEQGVGFLCGSPKSSKTWLALDLALSVATKTAALGTHEVTAPGDVLLFAAEDAPAMVRSRLAGMARQRGLSLDDLPIHLVLQRSLRLESKKDQARLQATVASCRPKLLVLDPFVRLSSIDENSSLEVSAVLAYLRALQTEHAVAILVVHHARKASSNGNAGGLALRGSGDFWAWSDSNLFLSRKQDRLQLAVEHRSAAPPEPVALELCCELPTGPYLRRCERSVEQPKDLSLTDRILEALPVDEPRRLEDLRGELRVRMQSLVDALRELERDQLVRRDVGGWSRCAATTNFSGETEAGSAEEQPAEG
jgi:hypothetical protein